MRFIFLFFFSIASTTASACPFCEFGANETAFFIVTILGLFVIAAFFVFLAAKRAGLLSHNSESASLALKAEYDTQSKGN